MLKVFQATDKTYSSNGDLIVNPLKAQVHKEDNGEFYLDLETPFNEKEVSIAKEEGTYTTINGTATIQNVDTTKNQELIQLDGDTSQSGTPTPESPIPINVVSGRQEAVICGKNLYDTSKSINGYVNNSGNVSPANNNLLTDYIKVKSNKKYTISVNTQFGTIGYALFDSNKTYVSRENNYNKTNLTITIPNNIEYIRVWFNLDGSTALTPENILQYQPMIEKGETTTTYEAYKGQSYEINLGKNLNFIPYIDGTSKSTNGIDFSVNENGEVIANNTATATAYFYCHTYNNTPYWNVEKGVYYLSGCPSGGSSTKYFLGLRLYNNTTAVANFYDYGNGIKIDTTSYDYNRIFLFIYINNGITCDNLTFKPMLEKGGVQTVYTPYKTPIELCKIGDYKDRIFKNTDKILVPNEYTQVKYIESSGTQYIDTGVLINSDSLTNGIVMELETAILNKSVGQANGKNANPYFFMGINASNKFYSGLDLQYIATATTNDEKKHTLKLDSVNKTFSIDGTIATQYVISSYNNSSPGNIYLCRTSTVGTYWVYQKLYRAKIYSQDTLTRDMIPCIRNSDNAVGMYDLVNGVFYANAGTGTFTYGEIIGKWNIEKQTNKVVLNGSEIWGIFTTPTYTTFYNAYINDYLKTSANICISNYFVSKNNVTGSASAGSTDKTICFRYGDNYNYLFISDSDFNSANDFTTWLSTHNTEVYYVLATPTYTEITDSELIEQLNAIKLIEGLNNISITSGDLAGEITIHYNYLDSASNSIRYVDYLVPNNIVVANTPQGEQAFRITNVEKTKRKIKIKAYHVFYDTENYLIQDSYVVDKNCNDALDHLNNATDNISPFTTISNITTIDSYRCVRKSLFEAIQVVIERWGGHLVRNNWTIGVYDTIGQDNGVVIRYAKNLKEITASYNWDEVVTKLLPVGKDGILLNAIDPTASVYVESTTQYDIPYTKTLSFSQDNISEDDYKDEEGNLNEDEYKQALVNDLMEKGQSYVQDNSIPKVNYTLSANVEKVSDIGDTIEVIDEKLGINIMTNIISYDYDCILDKYIELEFGNFTPTLSGLMETITTATEKIVEEGTNNIKITLDNDLKEATDKIWNALGNSYVIYEGDKILVVDSLPKETATNVIMINNGGIGFSNTGITGTFNSAWTIDNVLNMEQINVINMTADLIKGGTLKLGNNLNQNGQIEVYDEANTLIAELNKNGLKMYGVDGSYVLMNNQVGFSGYDRNDNPIYWVNGDEFHMKKSVIEEEITLCNKMRFIPITITDGNNQIVNDGIGLVSVLGGGN